MPMLTRALLVASALIWGQETARILGVTSGAASAFSDTSQTH